MKKTGINKIIKNRSYKVKYVTSKSKQFAHSELLIVRDFTGY